MKQFLKIFKYEFMGVVKNKIYLGITAFLVVAVAVVLCLPNLLSFIKGDESDSPVQDVNKSKVAVVDNTGLYKDLNKFSLMASDFEYEFSKQSKEELSEKIKNGEYEAALIIEEPLKCEYLVESLGMYDSLSPVISKVLETTYFESLLIENGMTSEEAAASSMAAAQVNVSELGKSFMDTYYYTYILIFFLYMAILLYGQMVATSVTTEKSSRAMELLITSARPNSLMFGKVIGTGAAGLFQLIIVLIVSGIFYNLNASAWKEIPIINSIFNVPGDVLVYTVIFFVLGFFLYAFIYGAIGSMLSRVEEMNTAVMPVILLFIAALFISFTGMMSDINSPLMVVSSFIPFFTPMTMFVRICMGSVPFIQIIISIIELVVFTVLVGYFSAKIYRVGVLMYGKPPKLRELFKVLSSRKR